MKKIIAGIRNMLIITIMAAMVFQPLTVFADDEVVQDEIAQDEVVQDEATQDEVSYNPYDESNWEEGTYWLYDEETGDEVQMDYEGNELFRLGFEPEKPLVEMSFEYVKQPVVTGLNEKEKENSCEEHTWDDGVVYIESTYTSCGVMVYTCTTCGLNRQELIPELKCTEHEWDEGTIITESTSKKEGKIKYRCKKCHAGLYENIPKLPCTEHEYGKYGKLIKLSTCSEEGLKKYYCVHCGASREEVVPKKEHETEWVVTKEATEDADGEKELRCKKCKEVLKKEKIEKIGKKCTHPFPRKTVQKVAPTCTTREVVDVYCNECGELVQKDLILYTNEENHPNLQKEIVKEATYEEPGIIRYYCKDCGFEVEDEIERIHCDHPSKTIYEHPDNGKRFVKCTVCKRLLREYDDELVKNCSHTGYGQKEVCVTAADETHWGEYNYVCNNCGKVMSTKKVHPYSTYTLVDENGETVTLYGWFDDAYAQQVFELTNDYREANGLNALRYNKGSQDASNTRALEAAVYFSHSRPTGEKWNSLTDAWKYGGENLAKGQDDPEWVMRSWKNSDGHNRNLLYGKDAGQTSFNGLSVGCFHLLRFNNKSNPSVPTEIVVWSQNFTF